MTIMNHTTIIKPTRKDPTCRNKARSSGTQRITTPERIKLTQKEKETVHQYKAYRDLQEQLAAVGEPLAIIILLFHELKI